MTLADQFLEAAGGARNSAALDELARKIWRAHGEGCLAGADAEAASEAVQARRAALAVSALARERRCSAWVAHATSTATPRSGSCIWPGA